MTKEKNCIGCGCAATFTKTVPVCARCGLKVAEEALGFVFAGLRGDTGMIELPAPAQRMSPEEANDVTYQRLIALRRQGAQRVTPADFADLLDTLGRSRPWLYRWLDSRVADGELVKDSSGERVTYAFPP